MKMRKRQPNNAILLNDLTKVGLTALVVSLNLDRADHVPPGPEREAILTKWKNSEFRLELRRLVKEWRDSGPNLDKLFQEKPDLARRCRGTTIVLPSQGGAGRLVWNPDLGLKPLTEKESALFQFMTLIINPEWKMLGGPCPRCEKYFIKKTNRQIAVYCSRTCATATTALAATRRKREEDRKAKLAIARRSIETWRKLRGRKSPWKEWVVSRHPGEMSLNWLTRAVKSGELQPPQTSDSPQ
jgi:hypothetical protein